MSLYHHLGWPKSIRMILMKITVPHEVRNEVTTGRMMAKYQKLVDACTKKRYWTLPLEIFMWFTRFPTQTFLTRAAQWDLFMGMVLNLILGSKWICRQVNTMHKGVRTKIRPHDPAYLWSSFLRQGQKLTSLLFLDSLSQTNRVWN